MKTLTFIFTIIGLIATFMIGSFLFTRYELLELSSNHHALYEKGRSNITFDDWLIETQSNLGKNQETILYLKELLPLVYPKQKTNMNQFIANSLNLINEHASLLNMLELEIENTPGLKKIWEIAFLHPESVDGKNTTQTLFKDLPELINSLQANIGVIEAQQQVSLKAKKLATELNGLLLENQLIGKAFMIEPIFPLARSVWLNKKISVNQNQEIVIGTQSEAIDKSIKEPKLQVDEKKPSIVNKKQNSKSPEISIDSDEKLKVDSKESSKNKENKPDLKPENKEKSELEEKSPKTNLTPNTPPPLVML